MLLSTGDQELIEGTWWHDKFWGICICTKCANKGDNNLGKILMTVREEISLQKILGVVIIIFGVYVLARA